MSTHYTRKAAFVLAALCVFTFSASAQTLKEKMKDKMQFGGKESSLQGKKVKEMTLISDPAAVTAPGSSFKIGITAVLEDGKEMKTRGLADGKVKWGNYDVQVAGGTFDDGEVRINADPRKIKDHKIIVKASPVGDSAQSKTIEVPLSFKAKYSVSFDGKDGDMGRNGDKGENGRTGSSDSKGAGGRGSDGRDGQKGGNGAKGGDAEAVDVYVSAFKDAAGITLLKVYARGKNSGKERFYIINPEGGSITISARGGRGGQGGRGGDGGTGGGGGNGHQYGGGQDDSRYGVGGDGGNGGYGADGGDGGDGGNGGTIMIYLDPSASGYASAINYANNGGERGGQGFPGGGASGGSGGNADTRGKDGVAGKGGKYGQFGREGVSGGKPAIMTQKVTIDWDRVAMD